MIAIGLERATTTTKCGVEQTQVLPSHSLFEGVDAPSFPRARALLTRTPAEIIMIDLDPNGTLDACELLEHAADSGERRADRVRLSRTVAGNASRLRQRVAVR
jgi:hypothetical protein